MMLLFEVISPKGFDVSDTKDLPNSEKEWLGIFAFN